MSKNASTSISVCIPKSFKSESAIMAPTALGRPPTPNCKVAPSGISFRIILAIVLSVSLPSLKGMIGMGMEPASTTRSTSEI